MNVLVLDASVVAGALFQEEHADIARKLLEGDATLHAPDLIYAELSNVIWKRYARGDFAQDKARGLLADILRLPLEITPIRDLIEPALEVALELDHPVYDCLYLALAIRNDCMLITADRRLLTRVGETPFKKHVTRVGSIR